MVKKLILVLFLALLCMFTLSITSLAESGNNNAYFELTDSTASSTNFSAYSVAIGMDFQSEGLLAGFNINKPVVFSDNVSRTITTYALYGGYDFVQGPSCLGVVLTYWGGSNESISSSVAGVGVKGVVDFDSGNLAFLYSVGLKSWTNSITSDDPRVTMYQVKGTFYIQNSLGFHLMYQGNQDDKNSTHSDTYGIGLDCKF